jgi:Fe-S cluster biosynthesis and repair protein YggX
MSNKVFCIKHQKDEPAIDVHIPFRGELKERVHKNICQGVWDEWLVEQVKIINELALNLGDPRSHDIIEQKAKEFFGFEGEQYESVEPAEDDDPPSVN